MVAYVRNGRLHVRVLYGEQSDWVRNLLAGGGQVVRRGRTYPLIDPSIDRGRRFAPELTATLGAPSPRFGRGPRSG